jgi:hypothetical protein
MATDPPTAIHMSALNGDVTTVQPGSSFGLGCTTVRDARKYTELKREELHQLQWIAHVTS